LRGLGHEAVFGLRDRIQDCIEALGDGIRVATGQVFDQRFGIELVEGLLQPLRELLGFLKDRFRTEIDVVIAES
jgi:hypothetical protein